MKLKITLFVAFIFFNLIHSQQLDPLLVNDVQKQQKWVDSIMNKMNIDQKIGQLFMVAAYSNKDSVNNKKLDALISNYHIGGLIFFQGSPIKQAELTNKFQKLSPIKLLIGIDAEWGLNMRLDSTQRFPWNMTLGAINQSQLIRKLGMQIGINCKRLGIHINFAPVVDINTNPKNPIIGNRSFGENKFNVAKKSIAFTSGLQSEHILACAKHFPGHGDTSTDSHKTLPQVLYSAAHIDSIELYPYKQLFDYGVTGVMVAHLSVPSLEPNPNVPTSLSYRVVTGLLQQKLGFQGLVFTDALNMKGASNFEKPGEIDLSAFLAGNDVLLFPENVPLAVKLFKKAIKDGLLTEQRLNYSVRKILKAKYWAGLSNYKPVVLKGLTNDLNTTNNVVLHRKLVEKSLTLLKNEHDIFPIKNLANVKIAYVNFGDAKSNKFIETLQKYADVKMISATKLDVLLNKLKGFDKVIIGFHKSNKNPWKNYDFSNKDLVWIQEIARRHQVILDVFASPYSLLKIKTFKNINGVLLSYQNSDISQSLSAQAIFGAFAVSGKLPVSIHENFKEGFGLVSTDLKRLSYGLPEEEGMSSLKLKQIDSIAKIVIDSAMAPGMQVLIARHGKVIFQKSYGYFTFKKKHKVMNTDIYDLASLTKILGTLPILIKENGEGKLNLNATLGELLPNLKGSNKDTLILKKVLSHNARLESWIPFYKNTIDSITQMPLKKYYRNKKSRRFNIPVAKKLYLRKDYIDSIYTIIKDSPLREKSGYKYSGLAFYLFRELIEKQYHTPLSIESEKLFFKPLGAMTLTYNPLDKYSKSRIAPTENDTYFRHQLLIGYVHDMGAAMMGGISGNAGLFSDANDVAKMMQLYLQKGFYGGKRYFRIAAFQKFNHRYYEKDSVRRGLGFDKPQLNKEIKSTCGCVSNESFGHSGFTGTFAWADPKSGIVYVFLSNRVYPTMENEKLVEHNIRTRVQRIIENAIIR